MRAFVSYSTRDWELCQELLEHLSALRGLELWVDRAEIQPGEDWRRALFDSIGASDVLLALVSPSWGPSDWCREEWARAEHARRIAIQVRPYAFSFDPRSEAQLVLPDDGKSVTEGRPTREQRDVAWEQVVRHIGRTLGLPDRGRVVTNVPSSAASARASSPPLISEASRTRFPSLPGLRLDARVANDTITLEWTPARAPIPPRRRTSVELEGLLREAGAPDLHTLAERGAPGSECAAGAALAAWLFGTGRTIEDGRADREALFRAGFGDRETHTPGANLKRVRLRLAIDEPELRALPWHLLAEPGVHPSIPLAEAGWTFEHALPGPADAYTLQNPGTIVVLSQDDAALTGLRETLETVWQDETARHLVRAGSWRELEEAVATGSVVAVHVPGAAATGVRLRKVIGFEERRLDGWFPRPLAPPPLVTLVPSTAAPMLPEIPGVRAVVVFPPGAEGDAAARAWYRELVAREADPVVSTARLRDAVGAAIHVHTRYPRWTSPLPKRQGMMFAARDKLDRKLTKADAFEIAKLLWGKGERRGACVVAVGDEAQMLQLLGRQIETHLFRETGYLVERAEATPPAEASAIGFERALAAAVQPEGVPSDAPWGVRLDAVRRQLQGYSQSLPLLLVDWGVQPVTRFNRDLWNAWVTAAENVAAACPDRLRLMHLLTIRADATKHDGIVARAHGSGSRGVLLRGLHPVGTVTELDLRHFLEDPGNSNCPPGRVPQVAAAIFARSGGLFERACIEIEGALEHGWHDLAREGESTLAEPTDDTW